MSLLQKTLLYLLLVAIPVAIGGGWLLHTVIYRSVRYEVDEQLTSDLAYVMGQLKIAGRLPDQGLLPGDLHTEIQPTGLPLVPVFSDTLEFDARENEPVPVRRLTATVQVGRRTYRVVVKQVMDEFEEIAGLLSSSVIVAFFVLLGTLIGLNGWVSRRLWQPFYQLTDQLRQYRLDVNVPVTFSGSNIDEFNQLSVALNGMSQKLHRQYSTQKEFTDHAAHEMQTPLAVVTTQLDYLLGTEPLTGEQVTYLEQAQGSVRRLVQLNKSLLLLTKLDNNQFPGLQSVDISQLVHRQSVDYKSFAEHRGLSWISAIDPAVYRTMNVNLADILFSNLLKNAVAHASPGTSVSLLLTDSQFVITNSGPPLPFPPEKLFGRFVKNPARPESTGLGLALVKQIAGQYAMTVQYRYDGAGEQHRFAVVF